jgi:hypothetical protein
MRSYGVADGLWRAREKRPSSIQLLGLHWSVGQGEENPTLLSLPEDYYLSVD